MDTRIATIFFYSELLILCSSILNSYAIDTIAVNRSLRDGETVISAGERFELGFFTPAGRSSNDRYVGIWYYNLNPRTVVWVANREMPLLDTSGYFAVDDGNLKVLDQSGKLYWWTDLQTPSDSRYRLYWEAKLMDSGNLVLRNQLARNIWESFEYPTDTFLSGMKMDLNLTLTSWTSQDDPAPGKFTFKLDQEGKNQFTIRNGYRPHWRNGVSGEFFRSEEIPSEFTYFLSNFNISFIPNISEGHVFLSEYNNTRVVMNFNGEIQYWNLHEYQNAWSLDWWEPKDRCSILNVCGSFGSCNSNNKLLCKCLPGFKPKLPKNWNKGDFYDGCTRNSTCDKDDIFLNLKMMKVENTDSKIDVKNKIECRDQCLSNYQCQAYSYSEAKNILRRDKPIGPTCWLWTEELNNLQEEYLYRGHDLFVRVSSSDIESTVRNCEACGTNAIPYPLSTGLNCGEPMYFSFYCNKSAGKLSFKAPTGTYNVANINPTTRTFVIQAKQVDNCKVRDGTVLRLNQSLQLPFILNNVSSCGAEVEFSSDTLSENVNEIEISWQPPLEPSCTSSADCKDWPYSTCNLTDGMQRCHCNANFRWDGLALNCTPEENYHESFGESSTRKTPLFFIIGVTVASIIVLLCVIACICIYRRKMAERQESRKNIERDAGLLYGTEKRVKDMIESQDIKEEDKKGIDVPFFYLNSILAATDNFSDINMLGRGGFGPVYKGTFPGGQEIAIKRLSSASGQGMEEFKNEVVLIARLQHRNLVKLLGYCIQGDENILLYEYMPNKSLDSFIFDQKLSILLDWEMRFDIILGVARGLLYLHQDSRLRIIHRDLKTSNILLDAEMNPKISDFGLAKIFEGKQTEGSTGRVIGTYGYMSPEYALDGLFSVKSDVFSFGVVVLEILSGRRSTGVFKTGQALNLLGYAWRLWREDKAHDFMDETLSGSCKRDEFLKCLHIALLCIQEDPAERPTMSNVVVMLSSIETATFPTPKQPAFVDRRDFSSTASSSSSKQEIITKWTTTR